MRAAPCAVQSNIYPRSFASPLKVEFHVFFSTVWMWIWVEQWCSNYFPTSEESPRFILGLTGGQHPAKGPGGNSPIRGTGTQGPKRGPGAGAGRQAVQQPHAWDPFLSRFLFCSLCLPCLTHCKSLFCCSEFRDHGEALKPFLCRKEFE